jgi:hypothetical protein
MISLYRYHRSPNAQQTHTVHRCLSRSPPPPSAITGKFSAQQLNSVQISTHDHASKQAVNDEPIHFPSMFGTSYRFADLRIPKLVSFRLHEAHICHPLYACGNDRLGERRLDQPRITPPLPDERKNSQLVASSLTLGWKAVRRVRHAKSAPTTFTPNLSKGRLNS